MARNLEPPCLISKAGKHPFLAVRINAYQHRSSLMAFLDRIYRTVHDCCSSVIRVQARFFADGFHRDERSPGIRFLLPYLVDGMADLVKGFLIFLSRKLLRYRILGGKVVRTA